VLADSQWGFPKSPLARVVEVVQSERSWIAGATLEEKLRNLKMLRDSQGLSEDEYRRQREKILQGL
jgi:hypothetical protein